MMSGRTWVVGFMCVFLFFTAKQSGAQSDIVSTTLPAAKIDSNYLEDYTHLLTARAFLLFQNASLLINMKDNSISKISYRPNVNARIGLAGFWKWFGLGLSMENPFYKNDRSVYGKTTTLDLRLNAFGKYLAGELFIQRYRGFYISSPTRSDGTYYIMPDMRTFSLGIIGYYIYNAEKFSIRAAFIQNQRQKKSAGSLVLRPAFLYYEISNSQGIIPEEIIVNYHIPVAGRITDGNVYSIGLAPGYIYTLVFLKNMYITASVFPGIAAQFYSFGKKPDQFSDIEFAFQLSGRFALGYNSDKWFLGGSVQTGFNEVPDKLNNALFNYNLAQFRVWGGTRFDIFRKKKKNPVTGNAGLVNSNKVGK
ncbi:MAG: DUF4421 family protein [Bacteroidetes bacterium]|nr:DUF4421 family protein [Bacteroidota bacterium]